MLKRIFRGISQLFTDRKPFPKDVNAPLRTQSRAKSCSHKSGVATRGSAIQSSSGRPFPAARETRGRNHFQRDTAPTSHHTAAQLLRDGRLRIGITGFHDTAFTVEILGRHDRSLLAAAVADLPCRVKMVTQRNILEGLERAFAMVTDTGPGRRGIVLITSGDAPEQQSLLQGAATRAVTRRIGIHVVCLGVKPGDLTGGPRINTKDKLGYGGFHWADTQTQLMAAIRDALEGLTPAFGMMGCNKAVILLDCSETMVEAYRGTTRIEMVMTAIQDLLRAPLVRGHSAEHHDHCRIPSEQSSRSSDSFTRRFEPCHSRAGGQRSDEREPELAHPPLSLKPARHQWNRH